MCVSTAPAEFSGTILYGGRCHHPRHGLIQVVGYQNTAVNLADGPNAMLLHVPARGAMSPDNFIKVGRTSDILDRMVDAVRPKSRGPQGIDWMGAAAGAASHEVKVFEHDIYTVLLATDPTFIPHALHRVAPNKRPYLNPALMEFYADFYADHTVMVCCFDNAEARRAKPLLIWYEPTDPDRLVLPALDCHTGEPPDLDARVTTDHWVIFGTDDAPEGWGSPVRYPGFMRHGLRDFLPRTVVGTSFHGLSLRNGDFAITHDALLNADLARIDRLQPTR